MNHTVPLLDGPSGIPNVPLSPTLMLTLARGFIVLFWSLLVAVLPLHGVIRIPFAEHLQIPDHVIGILVAYVGIMILRKGGPITPLWVIRIKEAMFLLLAHVYLAPFLHWWMRNPTQLYHAINVLALFIVTASTFYVINMLASEMGRLLHDRLFRAEARLSAWTSFFVVLIGVGWVIQRTSMETRLDQLGAVGVGTALWRWCMVVLPLPFLTTLTILWKGHNLALRRCAAASGKI